MTELRDSAARAPAEPSRTTVPGTGHTLIPGAALPPRAVVKGHSMDAGPSREGRKMVRKVSCPEYTGNFVSSQEPHSFLFCMCKLGSPASYTHLQAISGHTGAPWWQLWPWQVHCTCGKSGPCVVLSLLLPSFQMLVYSVPSPRPTRLTLHHTSATA